MFVSKFRNGPELTEANFHARLSHSKQLLKDIHPMMLASFCSLTKRYLQWPYHKKTLQNDRRYTHPSTKKKDVMTKRLRTQVTDVSHRRHRSASNKWFILHHAVWYLSMIESRLLRSTRPNCSVILLQQFLPDIRQISREFFIFQQNSAPAHMALEVINFSPLTLPKVERLFKKNISKQTQQ